jgi:DNA polymerase III delta subunit
MIYFIHGTDDFRIEEEAASLIFGIRKENIAASGCPVFRLYPDEPDPERLFENLDSASLFEPMKIICISKIGAYPKSFREKLANYAKERKLYAAKDIHVLISHVEASKKRNSESGDVIISQFKIAGVKMRQLNLLAGEELLAWVGSRAEMFGFKIDRTEAEKIADKCANNEAIIAREIEKASLAVNAGASRKDLIAMVASSLSSDADAFQMSDALAENRKGDALGMLLKIYQAGEEPLKVLGALVYVFRSLLSVKDAESRPIHPADVQKITGLQPWQLSRYHRLASRRELPDIQKIYAKLMRLDYQMKTGEGNPRTLLFRFVARC